MEKYTPLELELMKKNQVLNKEVLMLQGRNDYLKTLQANQAETIRRFHKVTKEHFGLLSFHSTDLDKNILQLKTEINRLKEENEKRIEQLQLDQIKKYNELSQSYLTDTQHQTEALREENEKLRADNERLIKERESFYWWKRSRELIADNERMRAALTDLQDQAWRNGVDSTTVHEKCKQALTPKD